MLTDLTIAQGLILIWMFQDSQKAGRKFWPYLLITAVFGSFGPLLYLILQTSNTYLSTSPDNVSPPSVT